jgi:hypothetical protein
MMHGAPNSLSYSLHCTQHNYTTYTSDTIDQQHKTSNLKQVMQKLEVTNFRNFCVKNSGISGLGKKRNFRNLWTVKHKGKHTVLNSDGKFPEIFTGGKFPETFPTMFAHHFLVAYFLTVLSTLPSFYDVSLHYL